MPGNDGEIVCTQVPQFAMLPFRSNTSIVPGPLDVAKLVLLSESIPAAAAMESTTLRVNFQDKHGSFLLIRTGPRFAVVEQRADRVYPIKPGEREGEPLTPERVGYCGGRSRLALRGGSAAAIPAALRPRRPDRAIASVAITRPGGRKPQRRRPAPPEQPRYRYRAPSVSSCSMIAPRHCSDAVLVSP